MAKESEASDTSSSEEEEEDQQQQQQQPPTKKAKLTGPAASAPLELAPSSDIVNNSNSNNKNNKPIIVLLDQAKLETVKNKRGDFELLNCDDHRDLCKRKLKLGDPKQFRPDICHQELLALLDSPLNKAGLLQVYIKTSKNVLIYVHPSTRIPRTFKRFSGLMVQLLHKMKIKAASTTSSSSGGSTTNTNTTLLKVIKNPFSQHLPAGTHVYGMSCQGQLYAPQQLAQTVLQRAQHDQGGPNLDKPPVCFIIGAMAAGHVTVNDHPYIEEMISVSQYPLSGASAISRIMSALEHHWGIV